MTDDLRAKFPAADFRKAEQVVAVARMRGVPVPRQPLLDAVCRAIHGTRADRTPTFVRKHADAAVAKYVPTSEPATAPAIISRPPDFDLSWGAPEREERNFEPVILRRDDADWNF